MIAFCGLNMSVLARDWVYGQKKIVRWVYNQQTKPRDTTFYQTGVTLAEDIGHTW